MLTRRRLKPSRIYNHLGLEKKSRRWQARWSPSADLYPSWESVVCDSISCYAKKMISSGMIKQQHRLLS
jgi:hypothetical protein